jgi:hypothetical protein
MLEGGGAQYMEGNTFYLLGIIHGHFDVRNEDVIADDIAEGLGALGHRVKLAALLADGAICGRAPILDFHELGQTRCIVWVLSLELLEGVFGHRSYPLPWRVGIPQPRADLL